MGSHMSFSQLSSLRKCSEQFRLERAGYPQAPAVWFVAGKAYHSASEDFDLHVYEHGKFAVDDDAQAFISQRWRHHFGLLVDEAAAIEPDMTLWRRGGRATKEKPNKEDIIWWEHEGEQMALAYARFMQDSNWSIWTTPQGEPAIELEMVVRLGDVEIKGSIDRVMVTPGGEMLVRDLKTSSKPPEDNTQLGVYAAMMELTFDGLRPTFGDFFMARTGTPTTPVPLGIYTVDLLKSEFNKAFQIRSQGLYLASPSGLCKSCGVSRGCAAQGGDLAPQWANILPDF